MTRNVDEIISYLRGLAKDAGNHDEHGDAHWASCAHDEAAVMDAADELERWLKEEPAEAKEGQ